jgi:hypothetical protein
MRIWRVSKVNKVPKQCERRDTRLDVLLWVSSDSGRDDLLKRIEDVLLKRLENDFFEWLEFGESI